MPAGSLAVLANMLTVLARILSGSYNGTFEVIYTP
jgi:hypothetical protein